MRYTLQRAAVLCARSARVADARAIGRGIVPIFAGLANAIVRPEFLADEVPRSSGCRDAASRHQEVGIIAVVACASRNAVQSARSRRGAAGRETVPVDQ